MNIEKHLILKNSSIKNALEMLNRLSLDAIIFVTDEHRKLLGSITDGDIRRGLLKGFSLDDEVITIVQKNPQYFTKEEYDLRKVIELRTKGFKIIPLLDNKGTILNIVNFRSNKSFLPLQAIIMAGGKGERLRPLTNDTPKPMLKVGSKPIIEHNIDHLINYGVKNFQISIKYLGEQIVDYFLDGINKGVSINYLRESIPLGTIGGLSNINVNEHEHLILLNGDILSNINYEEFYLNFLENDAMLSVASIPYSVNVPYAVLQTTNNLITSFHEKPTYTYYSNGGIYLMKKECIDLIPKNKFFNTTDLLELLIAKGEKVISYPLNEYWLDIGRFEDFNKAQEDVKRIFL